MWFLMIKYYVLGDGDELGREYGMSCVVMYDVLVMFVEYYLERVCD